MILSALRSSLSNQTNELTTAVKATRDSPLASSFVEAAMEESRSGYVPLEIHFGEQQQIINALQSKAKLSVLEKKRANLSNDSAFFALVKQFSDVELVNMDFDMFKKQASLTPESIRRFFSASIFLTLPRSKSGQIRCEDFLRYVQRSIDIETTSLQLLSHAQDSSGFLTEVELERYIYDLIPQMKECQPLDRSLYPYYVFSASRRFFFFLDPKRTRRVSIRKLAHSTIMEELMYLRRVSRYDMVMDIPVPGKMNWFTGNNALRIYTTFADLDKDRNGLLCKEELMDYCGTRSQRVQLTYTAVTRIFEENIFYHPAEMDYKGFIDLLLALENKTATESLAYFWKVLDVEKCGRLSPEAVRLFYRDIYKCLRDTGYDMPSFENVVVEINDILACNDSRGATFEDFIKSGQAPTVVAMLLDVNGFWQYDNRETLKQQSESESEEPEPEPQYAYTSDRPTENYEQDFEDEDSDNFF